MAGIPRGRCSAEIDGDVVVLVIAPRYPEQKHRPTWLDFYRRDPRGRTGIRHETFLVRAGEYEAIYDDVPVAGPAAAGRAVPLDADSRVRVRIRRSARAGDEPARRAVVRP